MALSPPIGASPPIEIIFLLPTGKKRKRSFNTESAAAKYLTATHSSQAPVSITYADGSAVGGDTLDRIYGIVFADLGLSN